METRDFVCPDVIVDNREKIRLTDIPDRMVYLLARRAPMLVYALSETQKDKLLVSIQKSRDIGATNKLLIKLIQQPAKPIKIICQKASIELPRLLDESRLRSLMGHNTLPRDTLVRELQSMIFSEKSSLAQSGICVGVVVDIVNSKAVIHTPEQLRECRVIFFVVTLADIGEHPFLETIVDQVRGEVGRLLDLKNPVSPSLFQDEEKVGVYVSPDDPRWSQLEIMVGDAKHRYREPRIDNSRALVIPLCPDKFFHAESQTWQESKTVKVYSIDPQIVQGVVGGGSRKNLRNRTCSSLPQTHALEPGETKIMEVPLDSGPYNANIGVVCVGPEGEEIDVIHFPATYLDAVRSYPDGENRIQVEIKNVGSKPVRLQDIHFRVKFYQGSPKEREIWELRKALQYAEFRGFHALEHLVYTKVLKGPNDGSLEKYMPALGDLRNIDNLWGDLQGLVFSRSESSDGYSHEKIERISVVADTLRNVLMDRGDIVNSMTGYQGELLSVFQNACSVGREKRVIFLCRNDIDPSALKMIIKNKGITDVFSVPGKRFATEPTYELQEFCQQEGIQLTSIDVVRSSTRDQNALYDLVGAKREKILS